MAVETIELQIKATGEEQAARALDKMSTSADRLENELRQVKTAQDNVSKSQTVVGAASTKTATSFGTLGAQASKLNGTFSLLGGLTGQKLFGTLGQVTGAVTGLSAGMGGLGIAITGVVTIAGLMVQKLQEEQEAVKKLRAEALNFESDIQGALSRLRAGQAQYTQRARLMTGQGSSQELQALLEGDLTGRQRQAREQIRARLDQLGNPMNTNDPLIRALEAKLGRINADIDRTQDRIERLRREESGELLPGGVPSLLANDDYLGGPFLTAGGAPDRTQGGGGGGRSRAVRAGLDPGQIEAAANALRLAAAEEERRARALAEQERILEAINEEEQRRMEVALSGGDRAAQRRAGAFGESTQAGSFDLAGLMDGAEGSVARQKTQIEEVTASYWAMGDAATSVYGTIADAIAASEKTEKARRIAIGTTAALQAVFATAQGFQALATPGMQASAVAYFTAAAKYGIAAGMGFAGVGSGGGGGGGGSRATSQPTRDRSRDSDDGGKNTYVINFGAPVLTASTLSELGLQIQRATDAAHSRYGS